MMKGIFDRCEQNGGVRWLKLLTAVCFPMSFQRVSMGKILIVISKCGKLWNISRDIQTKQKSDKLLLHARSEGRGEPISNLSFTLFWLCFSGKGQDM